jgi:hypothetical protein
MEAKSTTFRMSALFCGLKQDARFHHIRVISPSSDFLVTLILNVMNFLPIAQRTHCWLTTGSSGIVLGQSDHAVCGYLILNTTRIVRRVFFRYFLDSYKLFIRIFHYWHVLCVYVTDLRRVATSSIRLLQENYSMIHISDLKVTKEIAGKEMLSIRGGAYWSYFKTFNTRVDFGKISDGSSNTFSFADGSTRF